MKKTKLTKTEAILKVLKELAKGNISNMNGGICYNIEQQLPYDMSLDRSLYPAFRAWPYFSGSVSYPVPDPEKPGKYAAKIIYDNMAYHQNNMWSRTTRYGRLRRNLVRHLVQHFEAKVNKLQAKRNAGMVNFLK